jgi:predicted transporter
MVGTELSWEFMRDLGLVVFGVGVAFVAFGFSFSRIASRAGSAPNVTLMTTIGDAMMLAGACLAVTAIGIGYLMPAGNP